MNLPNIFPAEYIFIFLHRIIPIIIERDKMEIQKQQERNNMNYIIINNFNKLNDNNFIGGNNINTFNSNINNLNNSIFF